jgi:hypothetical protein
MTKTTQTESEINPETIEDSSIEEVVQIDYVKTDNVGMSIAPLADDSTKLSIGDGRWIVDIGKKFAICLSEEFEQAVMSCTNLNPTEWVGFIVGHDIVWTNPENNRQVRILVAERAVILTQSRSGASAEMRDADIEEWADSSNDDDEMSFKTVHAVKKWVKIGWVHSHCDMGVFWSGTDTNTMKEMRGIPLLLSIVYSRAGKGDLNRLVRIDKNDVLFGGKYTVKKDNVDDMFIYAEKEIKNLSDVPEEIQQKYIEILKKTKVITTTAHAKPGAATITATGAYKSGYMYKAGQKLGAYPYASYYDYWDEYDEHGKLKTETTVRPVTKTIEKKTITIKGVISQKAQEEIIAFGNMYYSLDKNKRENPSIATFLTMLNKDIGEILGNAKWKMKVAIGTLNKDQILGIISFYLDTEVMVDLATKAFHNFKDNSKSVMKNVRNRIKNDTELKSAIIEKYGDNWFEKIEKRLSAPREVIETTTRVLETAPAEEKPVEKPKPKPFMPDEKFTDWRDWYLAIPKKYKATLFDALFKSAMDTDIQKKIIARLDASLEYLVRNDEEEFAPYVATIYKKFVDTWRSTPDRYKEFYRVFYTSYFRTAFSPYFTKYSYNKDELPLQTLLNTIGIDYAEQFIKDFIVHYETQEELNAIISEFPKEFPVYKQTFRCPICKIEWILKEDADACEAACRERGRTKTEVVEEVVAESTAKKVIETTQTTLMPSTLMDSISKKKSVGKADFLFGMPVSYFNPPNVCDYCGSLFDTEEQAIICRDDCRAFLDSVKTGYLDEDGQYTCSYCGASFSDDDEAANHYKDCRECGVIIDYMIELIERQLQMNGNIKEIVNRYSSYFTGSHGEAPPFFLWLIDKVEKNMDVCTCQICNTKIDTFSNLKRDARTALTNAYIHEKFCMLNDKSGIVIRNGEIYQCGLCTKIIFTTRYSYIMTEHLRNTHALYPSPAQIEECAGLQKNTASSETICGETPLVWFLPYTFKCKICGNVIATASFMLRHQCNYHGKTISHEEYELWVAHEDDMLYDFGVPSPKKELATNVPEDALTTTHAVVYNGIIICRHCETTAGGAGEMTEHMNKVHPDLEVDVDEFNQWVMKLSETKEAKSFLEKKEKASILNDVFDDEDYDEEFEDLDLLFTEWEEEKNRDKLSKTDCAFCGEPFLHKGDDADIAEWNCFIHEVDCGKIIKLSIEAYTCAICRTVHPTIYEREQCEEKHGESDEAWYV